ncbi:PTS galactosamine/N-acetylgalactosamine transporter subunit IIA [Sporosalibacterium faouarense]|uniref:PTS galactosamine/N-acetylgalactosamine transporter subunit IIA n=1 Tax=Sporosalibacterium faouarense TaxID=516123 RepID=UPI00141D5CD4|nr:PTS galactosamine/N-acetylgalactosamine transporter subunit IIA [Sporosalibacterium faouarense]MTI49397.1 PTS sugar transporter subunit IIA [Bacillota bacterium]
MVGIIITGHGNFATGLKSVIDLVVGEQEGIVAVDFTKEDSIETLRNKLQLAVKELGCGEYVFFTDIPGGSPFKTSVEISIDRGNSEVLSGCNIPMIIEILFDRFDISAKELKDKSLEIGKKQMLAFEYQKRKVEEINEGI